MTRHAPSLRGRQGSRIPYLDGLRAYSILLVVLSHTNGREHWLGDHNVLASAIADGQLGVRIFFVISGFLITTLLLQEVDRTGTISIREFYERRVARIFPAYYLYIALVAVLTIAGVVVVPRIAYFTAATYTLNFQVVLTHFFRSSSSKLVDDSLLFAHFWSLSIEEQFYLLWPSCLVFCGVIWSRRLATAGVLLLPLLRLFAVFRIHYPGVRQTIVEEWVQDLICIGVLAAFAARRGWIDRCARLPLRFRLLMPWTSVAILFGLCPWLASVPKFHFAAYLNPSLQGFAVVLLIFWLLSGSGGWVRSVLELRPVVELGLISYSLYIWQQGFTLSPRLAWLHFPADVLAPVAIALVCYYGWELPMRTRIRAWFRQSPAPHS